MRSVFLDSNVVLYVLKPDDTRKAGIARSILADYDCNISVQTLNEVTHTLRRKTSLTLTEIADVITDLKSLTTIHPLTQMVYDRAWMLITRYALSTYDAMILGCAIESGFEEVLSEDMQDGQRFLDMLEVRNPFADETSI